MGKPHPIKSPLQPARPPQTRCNVVASRGGSAVPGHNGSFGVAAALLMSAAILFLSLPIFYNEFVAALILRNRPLLGETIEKIRFVQLLYVSIGMLLLAVSEGIKRLPRAASLMNTAIATKLLISA